MFVQTLWQVGDVKVGVVIISKGLEFGVERFLKQQLAAGNIHHTLSVTYTSEADFVTKVVKASNAILSVFVAVIFDEAKTGTVSAVTNLVTEKRIATHPLQRPVPWSMIDLELLISPKRRPQDSSISSVVSGWSPRM